MALVLLPAMVRAAAPQGVGGWEVLTEADGLPSAEVRAVEVTDDGAVWLAVRGHGLVRMAGGDMRRFGEEDGLVSSGVADLLQDRSGRLWAVGLGGFSVYDGGEWSGYPAFGPVRPRVIFSVREGPDGIWVAGAGGAGRSTAGPAGPWTVVRPSDGLPHPVVHAAAVDDAGTRWLATRTGLARFRDGTADTLFAGTNVRTIVVDSGGTLWFGTSDGVRELRRDGTWTHHFPGTTVLPYAVTADGSLWAGSPSHGLLRRSGGRWTPVPVPAALEGGEIHDVAVDPRGGLWIATSRGAGRYDPDR